ncbi:hypothetical protein VNO78_12359 [Psophocarpus tetragonolobus]|uniref:Uncharacterized protein n=1 Tax=Psophocarpus tetragonolobus TaxID=3891 RepID=A0AAN9XPS7_PSOTE
MSLIKSGTLIELEIMEDAGGWVHTIGFGFVGRNKLVAAGSLGQPLCQVISMVQKEQSIIPATQSEGHKGGEERCRLLGLFQRDEASLLFPSQHRGKLVSPLPSAQTKSTGSAESISVVGVVLSSVLSKSLILESPTLQLNLSQPLS